MAFGAFASGTAFQPASLAVATRKRRRADEDEEQDLDESTLGGAAAACVSARHRSRVGVIVGDPAQPAVSPMERWIVGVDCNLAHRVGKAVVVVMDHFSSYALHMAAVPFASAPGGAKDSVFFAELGLREALAEAPHLLPSGKNFSSLPSRPQAAHHCHTQQVADFFRSIVGNRSPALLTSAQDLSKERLRCYRSSWNVRATVPAGSRSTRMGGSPTFRFFHPCSSASSPIANSSSSSSSSSSQTAVARASIPRAAEDDDDDDDDDDDEDAGRRGAEDDRPVWARWPKQRQQQPSTAAVAVTAPSPSSSSSSMLAAAAATASSRCSFSTPASHTPRNTPSWPHLAEAAAPAFSAAPPQPLPLQAPPASFSSSSSSLLVSGGTAQGAMLGGTDNAQLAQWQLRTPQATGWPGGALAQLQHNEARQDGKASSKLLPLAPPSSSSSSSAAAKAMTGTLGDGGVLWQ